MKKIIITIFIFFSVAANATTWYISPTGNDGTGTGAIGSPWRTLYKATSTVTTAGDIIHVNAGTYTETQTSLLAVGVSIEGDGITSIIKASFSAEFQAIIQASSSVVTAGNQHVSFLKFDGNNITTDVCMYIQARSNFSVHDITAVNFKSSGFFFSAFNNLSTLTEPTTYATGNSFYNNIVTNCAIYSNTFGKGCLTIGGQKDMLIYNNTITQLTRGSGSYGIGWPIKLCNDGWYENVKIYNNTLVKEPYTGTYPGDNGWCFAIEMWNFKGGNEIYNNDIQGAIDVAEGHGKGTYAYQLWIHNNYLHEPAINNTHYQDGIYLETNQIDVIISDNHIKKCAGGIQFSPKDFRGRGTGTVVHDILIKNNFLDSMGGNNGNGIVLDWLNTDVNDTANMYNIFYYNNTMIAAPGAQGSFIGIHLPTYGGTNKPHNVKLINNIFQGFSYAAIQAYMGRPGYLDTLAIKNNVFYNNGNSNNAIYTLGQPTHVDSTGNYSGNPNFNAAYHPTGAPLVDAGINVGISYNGAAPDIGFFETGTDVTPPTVTSTNPASGATGVSTAVAPLIGFSEALNPATVTTATAYITGVTATVSYNANAITITPTAPLVANTTYTVTLTTGITDAAGNALAGNYSFSFTTNSVVLPTWEVRNYLLIKKQ